MRESLLDIRMPAGAALDPVADMLLAAGLGAGAALGLVVLVRMVTRRREGATGLDLPARIAALRSLPEDARRVGFLHLLKEVAPERHAVIRPRLYRPDGDVDAQAEVESHV